MNRILVITEKENDLAELLLKNCDSVTVISNECLSFSPDDYDALCVIGGNTDEGLILNAKLRDCVEKLLEQGKPTFCEFVGSIGHAYQYQITHTTHHRLVFYDKELSVPGLVTGDVLDAHENDCMKYLLAAPTQPIFTYHDYVCAHSHIDMSDEEHRKGRNAMWRSNNLIVCAFRLCNFRRARLAPRRSFEALLTAVVRFLAGEDVSVRFQAPVCEYKEHTATKTADVDSAIERGLAWFVNADMLLDGGRGGVKEGFSHLISAKDGVQKIAPTLRPDCSAETAGAFMLKGLLSNDEGMVSTSEETFKFIFDRFQIKDGKYKGMLRWTETAWEVCYADDVARVILPLLLRQYFDGTVPCFDNICQALDFLLETSDPDGLRVVRTELGTLDAKRERITAEGAGLPCAHYNAYYLAALLLTYRAGGNKKYLEIAERGLGRIMSLYPDTHRETSETEENCRLLFPLSALYEITKKKEHYEWLCRVADYLDEHRHESGAVPEWDTDYKASCSRNHTGECALLANNGDPVADLLYSNNWLPLGYAYAYMATEEERFYNAWLTVASFLLSCQICSNDKNLDGAWTRAFDLENWESHGVPHDVGWAPCSIETGWTIGEIIMGFLFMKQLEK